MNDILKQRLVGALILVALGVVFWPIIFVEPGGRAAAEMSRIPPRPAVDTTPIEPPDLAGLRPSSELAAHRDVERVERLRSTERVDEPAVPAPQTQEVDGKSATPAETKPSVPARRTRTEPPVKPVIDREGIPVAWILQVASVSSAEKAEQLRERLLKLDQKAYVKKVKRGDKALYRVYVGPKFERAELEKMQAGVDTEFGVKSMILRYLP